MGDDGQTVVECAEGWYCEDSVSSCYERVGLGGACSQDKACGDDLYCKESVCVTGLASGEACSRSTQCEGFRYDLNQDDPDQMVCKDDSHEVVGLPHPTDGSWIFPEGTGTCQCGGGILCVLTGRFFVPFLIVAIFFACLILCSCKMICCRSKPKPPEHLKGASCPWMSSVLLQ